VPVSAVRILVVDDFAAWRQSVRSMLQSYAELQIIGETGDGEAAVRQAAEMRPDLILLDVSLPRLNGIEAAKQIQKLLPTTAILFLSMNHHQEVVRTALNSGAHGYVLKADAQNELRPAIEAVLQGKKFVSSGVRLDKGEGR